MKGRVAAFLLLAALCGCRPHNSGETVAEPETGEGLYRQNCAMCHNIHGEGIEAGGNAMFPPVNQSPWVDGPPERLAAIILDGMQNEATHAVMPGWKDKLNDAQVATLMTWLRQRDGKPPVAPVEVSQVRWQTQARNSFWTAEDLKVLKVP